MNNNNKKARNGVMQAKKIKTEKQNAKKKQLTRGLKQETNKKKKKKEQLNSYLSMYIHMSQLIIFLID